MIPPLLLYLALLAGWRISGAPFDFDWTLCDKETACFVGGGCNAALTKATTQPSAPCDVTLSIRAYNSDKKTLLVRLLLQGAALDYGKGASLSVRGQPLLSCAAKAGKVALQTTMDEGLTTHSTDAAHLYCEAIVRHSAEILPTPTPADPTAKAVLAYSDAAGASRTLEMPYATFHDAIAAAVTCDPGLIKYDAALRGVNETTKKVSSLRHTVSCGSDPLWELVFESPLDSRKTEPAEAIKCVKDATTSVWGWRVAKRDGVSKAKVELKAHCVASVCLLCTAPTPCAAAGCVNAQFRRGEKKAGGVTCAKLECPPGHLFASADNRTAQHAMCLEIAPHSYSWTIDRLPVDTVQCVKQIEPVPPPQPPAPVENQMDNTLVIGICGGVLGLVLIVIAVYCIVCAVLKRRRGKRSQRTNSQLPLEEMFTGKTPDSDQEYAAPATGKLTEKTTSSKENNAAKKKEQAKGEGKGKEGKKGDGKGKAATTPKKKTSPSSKTSKTNKTNKTFKKNKTGRTKTDENETDDKRSREPTERDGDTERQSCERISNAPMKKNEPDHTPYESLINYEGVGDPAPAKIPSKPPKGETEKRRAQNTTTKTEKSAKDQTGGTPHHSQEDEKNNSVEPFRNNTNSKDELSKERDDRTQETEKKDKKK